MSGAVLGLHLLPQTSLTRKALDIMRQDRILCVLLVVLPLFTGCGPENGELASPPVGVVYRTGDMNDTIDGQMGLDKGGATASVGGGLGFAGEPGSNNAKVSCGPHGGDFRLRFVPRDAASPVLTLYIPEAPHGGHGESHDGDAHGEGSDEGHHESAARAVVLRVDKGRLSELTGTAHVSLRAATHAAGRNAVSGSFTAEIRGATLEGDLSGCYYFTG